MMNVSYLCLFKYAEIYTHVYLYILQLEYIVYFTSNGYYVYYANTHNFLHTQLFLWVREGRKDRRHREMQTCGEGTENQGKTPLKEKLRGGVWKPLIYIHTHTPPL